MKLQKRYVRTRFSEAAIRDAVAKFDELFRTDRSQKIRMSHLSARSGNEIWTVDNEDDFFVHFSTAESADYTRYISDNKDGDWSSSCFRLHYDDGAAWISVETLENNLKDGQRGSIQAVFRVLADHEEKCRLPDDSTLTSKPVIFIGHGRSKVWRELKDHLADKHNFVVEAYEAGARAGHTIRDILHSMLKRTSFALLVLTKEDETAEGEFRARQNVIHETGLFQGKLGFSRAIVLLENGTEEFSNIAGIEQLRFDRIQEIFGDVLAILKREFG